MADVLENPALRLVDELGNNVKTISYDTEKKAWTITYKSDLNPDEVENEFILDFLRNA